MAVQNELSKLDAKEQAQPLQEADMQRKKALQSQLRLWLARKERFW